MAHPIWNIELIPSRRVIANLIGEPAHILEYYSIARQRSNFLATIIPLGPATFLDA